jgi:hypothetical protein
MQIRNEFFTEEQWLVLENLYEEIMRTFYDDEDVNPYAYPDYDQIDDYIKTLGEFNQDELETRVISALENFL